MARKRYIPRDVGWQEQVECGVTVNTPKFFVFLCYFGRYDKIDGRSVDEGLWDCACSSTLACSMSALVGRRWHVYFFDHSKDSDPS